jgi:very-short-patch-repair endonuclease
MRELELPLFDAPPTLEGGGVNSLWRPGAKKKRTSDYEEDFAYQCRAMKLPEPVRQFYFAREMDRRFTADFAWPKFRLLVEIQGGIWRPGGGAHSHPIDIERDVERQQYVAMLRYTMLPLLPKEVTSGRGIELTQRILEKLGWDPGASGA